jgi:hypothetical protein
MHNEPDQELSNAQDRFDRFLQGLYSMNSTYHNEKEKMAHNIILLEMALLGAVITSHRRFSLSAVQDHYHIFRGAFILAWLVHILVRWQLRNRRSVAILVAAIQNAMLKWIEVRPTREEMTAPQLLCVKHLHMVRDWILIVLDRVLAAFDLLIFPFPWRTRLKVKVCSDAVLPKSILDEIRTENAPLSAECLVTIMSMGLLLAALWVFSFGEEIQVVLD